ncbi:hypothetical protein FG386_003019 [Cryptosporidium ryanae]|uniref:uncharacterized protein n=1 Tax=Cryptosporidium ryanae TaxID=515981 RepID=UPI00351A9F83|nr:hypothetical protein FG386_003019 [Cryptosporidium ryanae]
MGKISLHDVNKIDNEQIRQLATALITENFNISGNSRYVDEIINSTEEQLNQKVQYLTQNIKDKEKKRQEMIDELQFLNVTLQQQKIPKALKSMTLKELKERCSELRSIMNNYISSVNT